MVPNCVCMFIFGDYLGAKTHILPQVVRVSNGFQVFVFFLQVGSLETEQNSKWYQPMANGWFGFEGSPV